MKNLYKLSLTLFLFSFALNESMSQNPTYNLRAMNIVFASINSPNDAIEFDIYMEHTNPPVTFEYALGQYFFEFNSAIIPGDFTDTNVATYKIIGSDLPLNMQPRNPGMGTALNPTASVLRLVSNSSPGGNGYMMTNNGYPGTKIVRMRIFSKLGTLNHVPLNLRWRNPPVITHATKIFAYVGPTNTDITKPNNHLIVDSTFNPIIELISPAYYSTTTRKFIDFSWHSISLSVSYKLEVATDLNFVNLVFSDSTLTDTFKTISNLNPESYYYWRVSGKNDSAYFSGSHLWIFSVASAKVSLNAPVNNSTFLALPVNFTWSKISQITSLKPRIITYENLDNIFSNEAIILDTFITDFNPVLNVAYKLEVSTDQFFNNIVFSDSSIIDTSKTVSSLNRNTNYFWKVTPLNDSVFSVSSNVWKFNTNDSTGQVSLISPVNNATLVSIPVPFSWHKNTQAISYRLQISTDTSFINIAFDNATITDTFTTVNRLNPNTTYYWRLFARYQNGYSIRSPGWTFTTGSYAEIILNSPPNNEVSVTLPLKFSWFKDNRVISFKLQVSTDTNFNNIVFNDSAIVDTFKTVSNLNLFTKYYWKVQGKNDSAYFISSARWNFTTTEIQISPANNSTGNPTIIRFLWHKVDNAVNHVLQISTDSSFNNFIVNDSALTDTFKTVSGFTNTTKYYWRIKARYASNNFLVSNTWNFRISNGITYTIDNPITGSQVVPQTPSTAVGTIFGTYNDATNILNITIVFTGLGGPTTVAYFHGPAPRGANAPSQIPMTGFPSGVTSGMYTNTFILDSAQEVQIIGGLWYVNISTTLFPNGEIRGQLDEGGTLPVELSSFTSNVLANHVTLSWSTVSETNNSGFDIERRDVRGETQDAWIKIGFINGNGSINSSKNYSFIDRGLNSGKYSYRLKQIDYNGNHEYFNLSNDVNIGTPLSYNLSQNYPNPFNPTTKIDFEIPFDGKVSIVLYDISGREASTLINEVKTAGYYTVNFNAGNHSSGIYFYTIRSKSFVMTKKMMVVK